MSGNWNEDSYTEHNNRQNQGDSVNTNAGETAGDISGNAGNTGAGDPGSSVYSYNYRDAQNSATHAGDYDARRDDYSVQQTGSAQQSCAGGQTGSGDAQGGYGDTYRNNTQDTYQDHYQNAYQSDAQSQGGYDNTYQSSTDSSPKKRSSKPKKSRTRRSGGGFWQRRSLGVGLLKCVIFAVVFGLVAGGVFYGVSGISSTDEESGTAASTTTSSDVSTTSVSSAATVTDVSDIVAEVMPSIVSITNVSETEYYSMFGSESETYETESAGSGIIVAEDDDYLYIATNNHVVEDSTYLTITFYDESTASAEIKGTAASSDLAVVSVDKSTLEETTLSAIKIATLGDSTTLEVGESAIAIGNALGYGQSVTTGVISALDREVTTTDSSTGTSITNTLIQTDAAINPGNSGGALLNMKGEVIGINSVKYSDTDVEGMGYAIPISTAQPIIDDLISQEKVDEEDSAYLGISGVDVDSDTASTYSMPQGVYVVQVAEDSAAANAGMQSGDIITEFDGYTISSMEELQERLSYYAAGTEVQIKVQRNSNGAYEEVTLDVTLGSKTS